MGNSVQDDAIVANATKKKAWLSSENDQLGHGQAQAEPMKRMELELQKCEEPQERLAGKVKNSHQQVVMLKQEFAESKQSANSAAQRIATKLKRTDAAPHFRSQLRMLSEESFPGL